MPHTPKHKSRLLARVPRLKGQNEAIERALETDAPCGEVLNLVASIRRAVTGLTAGMLENHIREQVGNPETHGNPGRAQGAADLIGVIRIYMK